MTYSDGSLTDSSDFDLLLATPDRATRPVQSTAAKENNPEEKKQDEEPVECARQFMDTSSNDLELITEAEALEIPAKSLKSENMVSKRELLNVCCSLLDFGNQALEYRTPFFSTVNILFV